jgi:hypothetical protein
MVSGFGVVEISLLRFRVDHFWGSNCSLFYGLVSWRIGFLLAEEVEFFVHRNQTRLGPSSTLLSSAYGSSSSVVKETGVKLTTDLQLVPKIKNICSSTPCMMWCGI